MGHRAGWRWLLRHRRPIRCGARHFHRWQQRAAYSSGAYWWRVLLARRNWLARVKLLHAFAQNDIAPVAETPTPGYDDLRAEVSYTWRSLNPPDRLSEMTFGLVGTNLLNQNIRNSVSYTKDEVLLPGVSARLFARVKY